MKHTLAVAATVWLTFASGCVVVEVGVTNPLPNLSKVAVVPFFNLSQERAADGRRFALAYYAELQKVPGFQVVPVGVAEQAIYDNGLEMSGPEDALKLARILGVDIVVVGAVTDYDPYYPPRIGLQVSWYSPYAVEVPSTPGHVHGGWFHCPWPVWAGTESRQTRSPTRRIASTLPRTGGPASQSYVVRAQSDDTPAVGDLSAAEAEQSPALENWQPVDGNFQGVEEEKPPVEPETQPVENDPPESEHAAPLESDEGAPLESDEGAPPDEPHAAVRPTCAAPAPLAVEEAPSQVDAPSVGSTSAAADEEPPEQASEEPPQQHSVLTLAGSASPDDAEQAIQLAAETADVDTVDGSDAVPPPAQGPSQVSAPDAASAGADAAPAERPGEGTGPGPSDAAAPTSPILPSPFPSGLEAQLPSEQPTVVANPDPLKPLMSYTRIFDGADPDLVAKLRDYVELSGDRRSGGWEAYLHRSEDFIRFTAHLMVVEMLSLHGGETRHRFVFKLRKQM